MNNLDNVIDTLDEMKKAEPSASFTQEVLAKWKGQVKTVSMRTVWSVAAAITLLVAANVWIGVNYKGASTSQQVNSTNTIDNVVSEYGLSSKVYSY